MTRDATTLVGRDRELGLIGSFLGQAAIEGGVLLFTGEPGVGKTVILDTAVSATAAGTRVLRTAGGEFKAEVNFPRLATSCSPSLVNSIN